jgi:APA family basic amino acid/polyamine antiporter
MPFIRLVSRLIKLKRKLELKRALGAGLSTVFAVGLVLGAGIYSVIAQAVGGAGGLTWLPFAVLPAIVYLFIGLTYAEFASMYPSAGSAYVYAREGLSAVNKRAGSLVSFILLFSGLFVAIPLAAAVVALVFGQYLNEFLTTLGLGFSPISLGGVLTINPPVLFAIILVVILTLINWLGIKETAVAMVVGTVIEIAGLILIAFLGFASGAVSPNYLSASGAPKSGLMGLITAFAIGYFMYSGLELTPSLAEEAKEPQKTVPRAILIALALVAAIYMLVALGIVRLLPLPVLSGSSAAFIDASAVALGLFTATLLFAFFALFASLNTVLAELVTSSRLMYGIAKQGALPSTLGKISESRRTPTRAIILTGTLAALFCLFEEIQLVVEGAVVTICWIDFTVAVSLIASRRREPKLKRPFKVPLSVRRVPIPTLIAAVVVFFLPILLLLDNWITWIPLLVSLPVSIIFYVALNRRRKRGYR